VAIFRFTISPCCQQCGTGKYGFGGCRRPVIGPDGVAVPAEHDQFQLNAITRTRQNHRQESPSSSALAEPVAQIRRDLPRP
jgi:hypothetical protein